MRISDWSSDVCSSDLDYSKGLDRRFAAYEKLLETAPGLRGHVTYMQIAPPSRTDVQSYREIRAVLERRAGHINGRFAEFDWTPLRYLHKSFPSDKLTGFFRAARVGLVPQTRRASWSGTGGGSM